MVDHRQTFRSRPPRESIPSPMIALLESRSAGQYGKASWLPNIVAGVVVGVVALPLAMAFAIASGARPEQGIYTAIVAEFFGERFGRQPRTNCRAYRRLYRYLERHHGHARHRRLAGCHPLGGGDVGAHGRAALGRGD